MLRRSHAQAIRKPLNQIHLYVFQLWRPAQFLSHTRQPFGPKLRQTDHVMTAFVQLARGLQAGALSCCNVVQPAHRAAITSTHIVPATLVKNRKTLKIDSLRNSWGRLWMHITHTGTRTYLSPSISRHHCTNFMNSSFSHFSLITIIIGSLQALQKQLRIFFHILKFFRARAGIRIRHIQPITLKRIELFNCSYRCDNLSALLLAPGSSVLLQEVLKHVKLCSFVFVLNRLPLLPSSCFWLGHCFICSLHTPDFIGIQPSPSKNPLQPTDPHELDRCSFCKTSPGRQLIFGAATHP